MNRDFYTTPLQGNGRDSFDYGRTELVADEARNFVTVLMGCVMGILIGFAVGCWIMGL